MKVGESTMVEIRCLARQGLTMTAIGERLGLHRHTVRTYLNNPFAAGQKRQRKSIIDPFKPYLKRRLQKYPELTAARLHREISGRESPTSEAGLLPDEPYEGSVRTVRRHVAELRPRRKRVYKPIETLPGEQAQVDWGHFGHIEVDGQRKPLYAFSFVLSYSRIRYVEYTTSQNMTTFLNCHQRALHYIGGVPEQILYDNCKTVVADRLGSVVQFNRDLLRFAAQYSFKPKACWIADPESKGKVENSLQYVRRDFFYARPADDLDILNQEALRWCDEVANEKKHSVTREVPSDRLSDERAALAPLPDYSVDVFAQATRRVRKDATFLFETNQYSVPHRFSCSSVLLHAFEDRLEVYAGDELATVHRRSYDRGQLILDEEHYQDRPAGRRKRKSQLQADFESLGPEAADYLKKMARHRRGGLREQARKILALCDDHDSEEVYEAMLRSASFGKYGYAVVKRILNKQAAHPEALPDDPRHQGKDESVSEVYIEVEKRDPSYYSAVTEVAEP